jgi:teichuronic acid biosynthesis glycosyltransferase TuaC
MRVAVVAEYYPRATDPVLGVWAHRQALAARDAGADVRVLVLHRPVPARAALRSRRPAAVLAPLRQPLHPELDGVGVKKVAVVAPPRPRR